MANESKDECDRNHKRASCLKTAKSEQRPTLASKMRHGELSGIGCGVSSRRRRIGDSVRRKGSTQHGGE